MDEESEEFFGEYLISEERDGCAVVGFFVKMVNGEIVMLEKNLSFCKTDKGIHHFAHLQ